MRLTRDIEQGMGTPWIMDALQQYLVEAGPGFLYHAEPHKERNLAHIAAQRYDDRCLDLFKFLLDHAPRMCFKSRDRYGLNCLMFAIESNSLRIATLLLQRQAEINGGWLNESLVLKNQDADIAYDFYSFPMMYPEAPGGFRYPWQDPVLENRAEEMRDAGVRSVDAAESIAAGFADPRYAATIKKVKEEEVARQKHRLELKASEGMWKNAPEERPPEPPPPRMFAPIKDNPDLVVYSPEPRPAAPPGKPDKDLLARSVNLHLTWEPQSIVDTTEKLPADRSPEGKMSAHLWNKTLKLGMFGDEGEVFADFVEEVVEEKVIKVKKQKKKKKKRQNNMFSMQSMGEFSGRSVGPVAPTTARAKALAKKRAEAGGGSASGGSPASGASVQGGQSPGGSGARSPASGAGNIRSPGGGSPVGSPTQQPASPAGMSGKMRGTSGATTTIMGHQKTGSTFAPPTSSNPMGGGGSTMATTMKGGGTRKTAATSTAAASSTQKHIPFGGIGVSSADDHMNSSQHQQTQNMNRSTASLQSSHSSSDHKDGRSHSKSNSTKHSTSTSSFRASQSKLLGDESRPPGLLSPPITADVDVEGRDAIWYAVKNKRYRVTKFLKREPRVSTDMQLFRLACQIGCRIGTRMFVDNLKVDSIPVACLHDCVRAQDAKAVKILLDRNAAVDGRDADMGDTALMIACRRSDKRMVDLLLQYHADVTLKNYVNNSVDKIAFEQFTEANRFENRNHNNEQLLVTCKEICIAVRKRLAELEGKIYIIVDDRTLEYMGGGEKRLKVSEANMALGMSPKSGGGGMSPPRSPSMASASAAGGGSSLAGGREDAESEPSTFTKMTGGGGKKKKKKTTIEG